MIPKVIHYCWFGSAELSDLEKRCIESWKRYCPDYKIVRWDESNFDVTSHPYMKEAYQQKKWAFVSDLARLMIVYENGGVYLDTDVELIKSLDEICESNSFFFATELEPMLIEGREQASIATGLGFGAEVNNQVVKAMIDDYHDVHFALADGSFDLTPCPVRNTQALRQFGYEPHDKLYSFMGGIIYPHEFFCPKSFKSGVLNITEKTVGIHHYKSSWMDAEEYGYIVMRHKLNKQFGRYGETLYYIYRYIFHPRQLVLKIKEK